jgi:FRG domain
LGMLTWKPNTTNAAQAARDIVTAATFFHSTFKDEVWLWRGQANGRYGVEPGMHTRVLDSSKPKNGDTVQLGTNHLLAIAREARLDQSEEMRLPDLALLATLQHHGAATPLLDVSTDPLIALWMVAFANAEDPDSLDDVTGRLFGVLRPPKERWIDPLDARAYGDGSPTSIALQVKGSYSWYRAPDVTERLRIQRGSFLVGDLIEPSIRSETSMPFELGSNEHDVDGLNFVERRLANRGQASNTAWRRSEVFAFKVTGAVKRELRALLMDRSGLSIRSVYPTPWHKPFIEQFSEGYGRRRPLALDL